MPQSLGIVDLLRLNPLFDPGRRIKVLRHQDRKYDIEELVRSGWFETYQSYQRRPVLDRTDFVVSCVGGPGTTARFVGVYRVQGRRSAKSVGLPSKCPYAGFVPRHGFWYDLSKEPGFEALENRLMVNWGLGTRSWCQRLSNKEVVQLLPKGRVRAPFRDYLEFTLSYRDLADLGRNAEANREWRARLAAVAGVYLVVASTTGAQYVGSASGVGGIWGRWMEYAANGHGGNTLLRDLIGRDQAYPDAFRYSVLHVLPKTLARAEVLERERAYKEKLGQRATQLNAN